MPDTTKFANEGGDDPNNGLKANSVLKNRYRIMGVIGGGGMGTVYQARDLNFTDVRRLVAIKEMQSVASEAAMRASMLKNFRREANILATLSHPGIYKIFDFFDINERAYLVMEYISGSDLELILTKTSELPIEKIVDWSIELCDVLDYLHNQKPDPIVFRDMKPANIMIDNLNRVKLIDFGIAKTFVSGKKNTMIGTEGYSPPEQYKGDVSPLSDIYSLGATLHHIITRKDPRLEPPFSFHERPIEDYNSHVPPGFADIINKALAHDIKERYQSCAQMRKDLEQLRSAMLGVAPIAVGATASRAPVANGESEGGDEDTPTSFFEASTEGEVQPRWVFKTEDEIRATPATARELAFVGSYDTNIYAIKLEDGSMAWKHPTRGGIASSPVIDANNRQVLFGSEDFSFYAVDFHGREGWRHQTKDRIRGTARVAHDHVFFGSDDGNLYALNAATGRCMWAYNIGSEVRSRP
ncbi:MAG: protein kinase [Chloroflexi bacterium]|nr:protein kinase [Chloroflexota bacterium]